MGKKMFFVVGLMGAYILAADIFVSGNSVVYAAEATTPVEGVVYSIDGKDGDFSVSDQKSENTSDDNTYGNFSLSGDLIENGQENGVVSYDARKNPEEDSSEDEAEVAFLYQYDDKLLNTDDENDWKLVPDDSQKVGNIKLDEKVKSGAIIVQSSFDKEHWMVNTVKTNVFEDTPISKENALYTTVPTQLVNGCYYKVTVAYQTRKKSGEKKIGPFSKESYDYLEHVEVYEFYIIDKSENAKAAKQTDTPKYNLSSDPVNAGVDTEYSKFSAITSNDIKIGCEIGKFYINGFSGNPHYYEGDERKRENPIFLKNVGDKVTLWFDLQQKDIDALNQNSNYKILADEKGADKYFHVAPQNFKRGALIIRFTDYQNNSRTNVYTDYLASAATTTADTKVQLFEEGDYEVALDYEIQDNSPLAWKIPKPPKRKAYRIFFKFSIRNSNCMVYPIDLKTGSELRVPYTENGFKLNLARSRYLDLSIRKKILTSAGLDLRESQISNDQEEFSDEGLYIFTVTNNVTNDEVTKVIYVGNNNLLKAYARYGKDNDNGEYSINDLIKMQEDGYTFLDDGSIKAPEPDKQEEVDNVEAAVTGSSKAIESVDGQKTNVVDEAMAESLPSGIDSADSPSRTAADRRQEGNKAGDSASNDKGKQGNTIRMTIAIVVIFVIIVVACVRLLKKQKGKDKK